jgi:AraC-like DNA-binding protein
MTGREEAHGSTVGSVQVADLLEALQRLGVDTRTLAAQVGYSIDAGRGPDTRVASLRVLALLEDAGRALDDPLIGLHAGACVETRGPLFYLLLSAPSLSEGLALFSQFAKVPLDSQVLHVTLQDGVIELAVDLGDPALRRNRQAIDYIVGANLSSVRRAAPGCRPIGVELAHPEVGEPGETARVFGCPVRFGSDRNALCFPESIVAAIPAAANAAIAEQIRKYTATLFATLAAGSMRDRVADTIRALLVAGIAPDRAAIAHRLHVSERTLQRQLEQEATTFKDIRDTVRCELSQALLSNRALTVEAVAQSVGFAEVASFSKAFGRWAGCSPSRFRTRLSTHHAAP